MTILRQGIQKGTLDWKKAKLGLIWRQIQNLFISSNHLYAEIFLRSYDVTRRIEGYYTPSDVIAAGDKILQNFVNSYMYKRTLFTNDLFDCGITKDT